MKSKALKSKVSMRATPKKFFLICSGLIAVILFTAFTGILLRLI